jgi:WD40 repeat protein
MTTLQPGKDDVAYSVVFSSDDRSPNAGVQVRNLPHSPLIDSLDSGTVAVSPDFSLAAFATQDGTLDLLNVGAESVLARPAATLPSADSDDVLSIAFSPNGHLLAAGTHGVGGGERGTGLGIRLWNVSTHDLVGTLEASNHAPVDSVAFTPDNSLLAAGTFGDGTQVWNVTTRRLVTTLKPGNGNQVSAVADNQVSAVAFSGHGLLAAGTDGGGVQLWDVGTRQLVATLHPGPFDVSAVAFSPSGDLLAVGTKRGPNMGRGHPGGGVQVWNTVTHELVTTLVTDNADQSSTVAFSRTGSLLAATGDGIRVWNASRLQTASFGSGANPAAFSQDGTVAAIPAASGIQLWDTATGQQAGTVPEADPSAGDLRVAFSPDDTLLAAGGSGGSVQLWKVPYVADTAGYLCSVAGESFPPADWARYAPGIAYQKTCS